MKANPDNVAYCRAEISKYRNQESFSTEVSNRTFFIERPRFGEGQIESLEIFLRTIENGSPEIRRRMLKDVRNFPAT